MNSNSGHQQVISPLSGSDSQYAFGEIAPVVVALTSSGSGRLRVIKKAFQQGLFQDMRLLKPALTALEGTHAVADYLALEVLPAYGKQVLAYVLPKFDSTGKGADARRLMVIASAGGEEMTNLIVESAAQGSEIVRRAAIRALAGRDDLAHLLLEWMSGRNRLVREAAYEALSQCRSEDALSSVVAGLHGQDGKFVQERAYRSQNPALSSAIVHALKNVMITAHHGSADEREIEALQKEAAVYFHVLRDKAADELCDVYRYVVQHAETFRELDWMDGIYGHGAKTLERIGTREALTILFSMERESAMCIRHAFRTAARQLPADELYHHYAEELPEQWAALDEKERLARLKQLQLAIYDILREQSGKLDALAQDSADLYGGSEGAASSYRALWDERWLDWAIDYDKLYFAACLARPDHDRCKAYFHWRLHSDKRYYFPEVILRYMVEGMTRAGMDEQLKWVAVMRLKEDLELRCGILAGDSEEGAM